MKNYIKIFSIAILALLASCSDESYDPVYNVGEHSLTASSDVTTVDMTLADAGNEVLTLSWTEAQLNEGMVLGSYQILFDESGNNFENVYRLDVGTELSHVFLGSELNDILVNKLMLEPDVQTSIDVMVVAKSGNAEVALSNLMTLNVTPYPSAYDLTSTWGIVGSATPSGWSAPDIPMYQHLVNGAVVNNEFVAYCTLTDGFIKFRENEDWAVNYGDNGADGTLEAGGSDIAVVAGYYQIIMNLDDLTYSVTPFTWGVIGDATPGGWSDDTDLQYDPTSDQFRAVMPLTDGYIKFRMNDAWTTNLGSDNNDGNLQSGGADIPVTAGNYVITLNLNENTYTLEAIDHIWGLVGSATPNGWGGPDMQMNLDYTNPDYTTWYLDNVSLTDGFIKFRGDNDWNFNYGDDGVDGILDSGGADIAVSAGTYNIVLDLAAQTYTIQ